VIALAALAVGIVALLYRRRRGLDTPPAGTAIVPA
jgi:hypothetical protein